ncbi:pentatricopeptide repeat-containing protein At1g53600, mitochondrial [Ziziphus jujuba]|uniref:Pentatricopeptide repeat-containing protein At1g53600, mitochondrial n=1 Tax=Ziziphus jujuba TaxID=326968 RepID=A0A6P4AMW6_ZIZJJ|nr:pentatricopeptide repeat-containing protein At1g53600, mitochondrial [Ziziphus jujuba]
MPVKPTTKTGIFYVRLYYLKCSGYIIRSSCFSTQTLSHPSLISAKAQSSGRLLVYCNSQITKYGRNGNILEAESLFNRMPNRDTISWTAMLTAYAQNGEIVKARDLFDKMPQRNTASYNAMISAYIKNSCMIDEAAELFRRIPECNAVSYAAMVTGFVQAGMFDKAEKLYSETPVRLRDPVCSNALISGCLKLGRLGEAFRVFDGMLDRDVVSWSSMVDGCCKLGKIVDARCLFDRMPGRNVVTWTSMIDGYMKNEEFEEGFKLFLEMRREQKMEINSTTFSVMFEACGSFAGYEEGIQMHGLVSRTGFDFDVFLGNSIITMYCRFGYLDAASKIFHLMRKRDVVSWNSLIAGYVQCNETEEAFKLFHRMPIKNVVSWTTVISGFFNQGLSDKAIHLFEMMPEKDSVSWTALVSGFVNNGDYEKAFRWFIQMLRRAVRLEPLTFSSMLSASAGLATLNQGVQIHALVLKMGLEFDLSIQNALVSMYSKCGNVVDAYQIFTKINSPNVISYNSMITGFSQNGLGEEALNLFSKLQNEGCGPNEVTFLGVLSACVHVGLVEEGWKYFKMMKPLYSIEPGPDHYACMVDLLGRAGLLDKAMELINSMPFDSHPGVWGALLGASKTHLRLDLAQLAAQKLMELEPDNPTPYVVLSNLCSLSGKKQDGDQVRMAKKSKGLRKSPGCSWVILKDMVHLFLAGDQSHVDWEKIKVILWLITMEMRHLHCHR